MGAGSEYLLSEWDTKFNSNGLVRFGLSLAHARKHHYKTFFFNQVARNRYFPKK